MSKHKGYISLYRDIQDHWLWDDKPYARGQAFIDLIIRASHADKKICFNGKFFELEKGEFITSILKLSEAWGWSRWKVTAFLALLETDNMISFKTDNKKTTIKVLNFGLYQKSKSDKPTSNQHQTDNKTTQSINSISKEILLENKKTKVSGDPKGHTDF